MLSIEKHASYSSSLVDPCGSWVLLGALTVTKSTTVDLRFISRAAHFGELDPQAAAPSYCTVSVTVVECESAPEVAVTVRV